MFLPETLRFDDLEAIQIEAEERKPGFVAVRLGLVCSLYVRDPYAPDVRARLAQCGDQYQQLFGEHLKSYQKIDGTGNPIPYPAEGVNLTKYVQEKDSLDKSFAPVFYGDADYHVASKYGLDIFACSTRPSPIQGKPAHFSAVIPFSWLKDKDGEQAFQKLVHEWCQILKPFHGYAGIGAIQSMDMTEKKRTSYLAYPLARRFPGLEVDDPGVVSNRMWNRGQGLKIKGVNWLTALDNQCLEELGGRDKVLSQLDNTFVIYDYDGGVLIQAGLTPQLGDVNTQHVPHSYRMLSNIVKPLRMTFPNGHSLMQPRTEASNTEVTNAWLARFDDPF